ncbi:MAG: GTP-dependent dephospho-CoA kinase family protein [Candidatus Bathyarchaeia archaeon]
MTFAYILTTELRTKLKKPLGILIQGSFNETMAHIKDIIESEKPSAVISVGDTVSKNLVENGIIPKLAIVDNKVMRKKTVPVAIPAEKTLTTANPAGTITEEAITTIKKALQCGSNVKILVNGEEDLLALIAVLNAPQNSLIIYGQPHQGVVVIKVTEEKRREIAEILKAMENVRKAK